MRIPYKEFLFSLLLLAIPAARAEIPEGMKAPEGADPESCMPNYGGGLTCDRGTPECKADNEAITSVGARLKDARDALAKAKEKALRLKRERPGSPEAKAAMDDSTVKFNEHEKARQAADEASKKYNADNCMIVTKGQ